ncbi:MAG: gamma-glutamyl-gamma-aminobutyrate hydrolase family protein [Ruminococcaceae bacterium]|nr:gamma-glutamyl-gamma-aminobutyrate hydrolase family protein [Oscillospiraceae bacterium]
MCMVRVYIWGEAKRYANYQRAIEREGGAVRFGGTPEGCDALLLPGGGDLEPWRYGQENTASRGLEPVRDAAELALLDWFTAAGQPVLGICRGMQTINVYFGGTLLQDIAGHTAAHGIDRLHRVRTAPSPLRSICGERCIVNSAHHQAVDRLGAGLDAVQWTADGIVEAVCHQTLPVWGFQWHPERLDGDLGRRVFGRFLDLCR